MIAFRTFSFCQFNAYDDEVHVVVAQEGHVEDAVETLASLTVLVRQGGLAESPRAGPRPVEHTRKDFFLRSGAVGLFRILRLSLE